MLFLYNFGLEIFNLGIRLASAVGNSKAKQWISGRRNQKISFPATEKNASKRYWFHCSSLGEFEQGRPLIEALRQADQQAIIILTFFSPSGYEIRKSYTVVDHVYYLPLDGRKRAKHFINTVNADIVFFIKYDYWFHYLRILKEKNTPVFIISAIFRPTQHFFASYGSFFRSMLSNVTHFFLQDEKSAVLLKGIGIHSTSVTGDTRFDRVLKNKENTNSIPLLNKFKGDSSLLIAGSTWPDDEQIILNTLKRLNNNKLKLVIAPHDIGEDRIRKLINLLRTFMDETEIFLLSDRESNLSPSHKVLIMDTMGQLSSAYSYGDFAYVGGGFNRGIHNTLEAAAFGIPIIIGPNHAKFREAKELIECGAAFCVHSEDELALILDTLIKQRALSTGAGQAAASYIILNSGATEKITRKLIDMKLWPSHV